MVSDFQSLSRKEKYSRIGETACFSSKYCVTGIGPQPRLTTKVIRVRMNKSQAVMLSLEV